MKRLKLVRVLWKLAKNIIDKAKDGKLTEDDMKSIAWSLVRAVYDIYGEPE